MKKKSMVRKITAMLLVPVMAMSIAASSMVTASAAKQSNSIDAGSIAKDIASGYVKEIVDATAGSNPVTSVLGSVGLDLFNKMLNGGESKPVGTDEILEQVNELSNKIDAYHAEEMSALKVLSEQMELLNDKMDLAAFTNNADKIAVSYELTLDKIWDNRNSITDRSMTENTKDADQFVIDNKTYDAYTKILSSIDSDNTLETYFRLMYKYVTGGSAASSNAHCFDLLIDAYALLNQIRVAGNKSFSAIPDYADIGKEVDGIEADIVMYYATYMNIIQMRYQCENHEAYVAYLNTPDAKDASKRFTPVDADSYTNQISTLHEKMVGIDEMYQQASAYFESMECAQVTANNVTKEFPSADLAWSEAVRLVGGNTSAQITLLKDWTADGNGSLNPNMETCSVGFNDNGKLTANLSGGDLTICLNQHNIDMSQYINDTLLTVTGNRTLTIYGYDGSNSEDTFHFGGGLYGGRNGVVYNASSAGAKLVMENVKVYEPYDKTVVFNGKDQSRDSVSISRCFLNNTHHIPGQQDNSIVQCSNCTLNVYDSAIRSTASEREGFKLSNVTKNLYSVRYYTPTDFIIF